MVAKYTTIISKTKRLLKRFALNLIYNILQEPARGYLLLRTKSDFDLTTAKFYQPNVLQGCTSISGCNPYSSSYYALPDKNNAKGVELAKLFIVCYIPFCFRLFPCNVR